VFDRFKDKLTGVGPGKINVCSLSDEIVEAVLLGVTQHPSTVHVAELN
jgi:hypothetical protein